MSRLAAHYLAQDNSDTKYQAVLILFEMQCLRRYSPISNFMLVAMIHLRETKDCTDQVSCVLSL